MHAHQIDSRNAMPAGHNDKGQDIVIVGGGIAGAALATTLARAGRRVLVLESTEVFRDRVRGESMMPWGVAEAQALGVADLLHAAGAHTSRVWKRYTQGSQVPRDLPVGMLIPGVGGTLNLAHPLACQALLDAAAAAGASVLRGVRDVAVVPGERPKLTYRHAEKLHTATAALVVGADGRGSVMRRCAGIVLEQQEATSCVAGLLLDGVAGPDNCDSSHEHELGVCLLLHQGGGRARAYHIVPIEHRTRYAGESGAVRFLTDATAPGSPLAGALAQAWPAGPRGAVPGTDTWTSRPYADGVVLIGDAAGHNDPGAGCGLSVAMRDARMVRDLVLAGARRADEFAPYGAERVERMRRLRFIADLIAAAAVEAGERRPARRQLFAEAMANRDAEIAPIVLGMFAGPETIPVHFATEAASNAVLARIRAA